MTQPILGDALAITSRAPSAALAPPRFLITEELAAPLPPTLASRRAQQALEAAWWCAPVLVFVLAAACRLWSPDLVTFDRSRSDALADARALAASGPVSWALAPVTSQIYAALTSLPRPTEAFVVVLGTLDALAAVAVFGAAGALAGRGTGFRAGLLYALAPWAWAFARDSAPRGMAILPAAAMLLTILGMRSGRSAPFGMAGALIGLAVGIEWSAWVFGASLIVALALDRQPVKNIMVVLAAGAVVAAFGLVGQLSVAPIAAAWSPAVLSKLAPLIAGFGVEQQVAGGVAPVGPLAQAQVATLVIASALLVGGLALAVRRARNGDRRWLAPVLFVTGPALGWSALGTGAADAPLASVLPAALVLIPIAAAKELWPRPTAIWRAAAVGSLVMLLVNTVSLVALMERAANDSRAARVEQTSLRFWRSLVAAIEDGVDRAGAPGVTIIPSADRFPDASRVIASLVGGAFTIRELPADMVSLPTDHEELFVLMPGSPEPDQLVWPSSLLATIPLVGGNGAARVVSLRARPSEHWLAGVPSAPELRFPDGSVLLGSKQRPLAGDRQQVDLYWRLATRPDSQTVASQVAVAGCAGPPAARLPDPIDRRPGEILAQRLVLPTAPVGTARTPVLVTAGGACLTPVAGA